MIKFDWLWALVVVAIVVIMWLVVASRADERGDWFKSLKQPLTGATCCDVSDCRHTTAEWKGGQWWADVQGQWTPIPREKELKKPSFDGEAYVCSGYGRKIFCFIPPTMAM